MGGFARESAEEPWRTLANYDSGQPILFWRWCCKVMNTYLDDGSRGGRVKMEWDGDGDDGREEGIEDCFIVVWGGDGCSGP